MSNVGMSNERCQIYMSNDAVTHLPTDQFQSGSFGNWVMGSFDN